jgi:hypothetical protein
MAVQNREVFYVHCNNPRVFEGWHLRSIEDSLGIFQTSVGFAALERMLVLYEDFFDAR